MEKAHITRNRRRQYMGHATGDVTALYRDYAGNLVSVAVNTSPSFSAGATTTLFAARQFANRANRREYDVTPDDKRLEFVRPVGGVASDQLVVVNNWFEELNAKPKQ